MRSRATHFEHKYEALSTTFSPVLGLERPTNNAVSLPDCINELRRITQFKTSQTFRDLPSFGEVLPWEMPCKRISSLQANKQFLRNPPYGRLRQSV